VTGTLSDIAERAEAAGFKAPAIIVVGEVVGLRRTLGWFERRPLLGKRVVVTRAREQASDLVTRLTEMGADCLQCPTIKVAPPDTWDPLDGAIDRLADYDWIVFTSVNGVRFFFHRLHVRGLDVRALHWVKTAVIGPATRDRLAQEGLNSDIIPESYRAESVAAAFAREDMAGRRVLLPRAEEARPVLPLELRRMGAEVDEVTTYVTIQDRTNAETLLAGLREGTVDLVTFTSSSTVKNFKALLPPDPDPKDLMAGVRVASIGPITSETARDLGFAVHIEAESYTIPGLCEAIRRHFTG
jgi:uroporphyrinogen III methyltransferase/synthase